MKRLCFLLLIAALLVGMNSCQPNYDDLTTKDHAALLVGEYNIQANSYRKEIVSHPVYTSVKMNIPLADYLVKVSVKESETEDGGIDVIINWTGDTPEIITISHNELVNAVKQWTDAIFFDASYVIEKDGYTIAFGVSNQTIYSSKNVSDLMISTKSDVENGFIFYGSREKAPDLHTVAYMAPGYIVNEVINNYLVSPISKIVFQTNCTTPQPEIDPLNDIHGGSVDGTPVWIEQENNILYIRTKAQELFADVDMGYLFGNMEGKCFNYVTEIDFGNNFNTINVCVFDEMFSNCYSIEKLDLSCFNTENAVSFNRMFVYCKALKSLNISSFNTENVEDMGGMFAGCQKLETLNLSHFKTPKLLHVVSDLTHEPYYSDGYDDMGMFTDCQALTSLNLSGFDTSKVDGFSSMFENCISLKSLDLSSFETSNVRNMDWMFINCYKLESIKLEHFDVSNVESFGSMFADCHSLKSLDFSYWKHGDCTMYRMFYNCYKLNSITFGLDFEKPDDGNQMFVNMGRDADPCNIYYYEDDLKTWILEQFPELGRPTVNFSKMEIIYE